MFKKLVKTEELFDCTVPYLTSLFDCCEYPWDIIKEIKNHILFLLKDGLDDFKPMGDNILIGKNVKIYPTATIEGPCIIGHGTEIRPGAFLRGSVITGENCVIGNSSELKNCILLNNVQVPHYNYVGDSVLGNKAHMGAGSICSNLKSDNKPVVIHGETDYITGMRKIGGILGDYAYVGCGCVLNPGTIIGKNTQVYPLNALRGVFPAQCIVKTQTNIVVKR